MKSLHYSLYFAITTCHKLYWLPGDKQKLKTIPVVQGAYLYSCWGEKGYQRETTS